MSDKKLASALDDFLNEGPSSSSGSTSGSSSSGAPNRRPLRPRDRSEKRERPEMSDEAKAEVLRAYAESYGACPYKKGDLVTPRSTSHYRGAGEPHIVLEVFDEALPPYKEGDLSSPTYGARVDMRVMALNPIDSFGRAGYSTATGFVAHPYTTESFQYEPWKPKAKEEPVAEPAASSEESSQ